MKTLKVILKNLDTGKEEIYWLKNWSYGVDLGKIELEGDVIDSMVKK